MKITDIAYQIIIVCGDLFTISVFNKEPPPEITHDGLVRKHDSNNALAYVSPDADFSRYKKVAIMDVYVAFQKYWNREHRGISKSEMVCIKRRIKNLFRNVFVDVLEEGGYPVVYGQGDDVLLIRPAIIDLDITVPDVQKTGRRRTYAANAGVATLYVELFDSNTSAILARAIDPKARRNNYGNWRMTGTSGANSAEAHRVIKGWATLLRDALNRVQR